MDRPGCKIKLRVVECPEIQGQIQPFKYARAITTRRPLGPLINCYFHWELNVKVELGKIEGNYRVVEPFQLNGMVTGDVTVEKCGVLHLNGTVVGSLVVEAGGAAVIRGTVGGSVINKGGDLDIFGVVRGRVTGVATIDANAVVG